MRRSLFVLVGLLFAQLFSFGQNIPPAEWSHDFPKKEYKVGDEVEITFKAIIPGNYHIYSNDYVCEFGPLPSEFIFEENASFSAGGKAVPIGAHKFFDDIFKCDLTDFKGTAEFRQKIKVLSPDPVVKGRLDYQMCTDDGFCVLHKYNFSLEGLQVSGKAAEPVVEPVTVVEPEKKQPDPVEVVEVATDSASDLSIACCDKVDEVLARIDEMEGKTTSDYHAVPLDSVDYTSYRGRGPEDVGKCEPKSFPGEEDEKKSYWTFFILAFLSGLVALLTPCVFPMIPMTVSFFMKEGQSKAKGRRDGLIYGLSIIAIYTLIGTLVSWLSGPSFANWLSTHWVPNLLFFIVFWIFAASFFGAFELVLPSRFVNKVDQKSDQGGLIGIFFMAFTIVLVSFSCTGPIVGVIIVEAVRGDLILPMIGMFGFSLAFALPFSLFAIFPTWLNSLPKSGGWLNSVKVVLGFVELALGLKFLSIADQTYHWGLLDREIYLALWIVIFALMGLYLIGKIKFAHDSDVPFVKVPRLIMGIFTFTFVIYLIPGMFGAPLNALAGYLPPMSTHDFDLPGLIKNPTGEKDELCENPKYSERLHLPHGIEGYFDYEQGMECARKLGKPAFIDFTGWGCVNCREMEARVWSDPRVLELLKKEYVVISLYVDDNTLDLPEDEWYYSKVTGDHIKKLRYKNADIQTCYFDANAQPLYALLDNKGDMIAPRRTHNLDKQAYVDFLEDGLKEYKKRMIPYKK